jgi:TRAP-type C4-dicarboxylate transport system permease small subunit
MRAFVRAMDWLYFSCVMIAVVAVVGMTLIIFWSVCIRYAFGRGSFWAEPVAIFLAIQMSFYGAAACYRAGSHLSLDLLVRGLSPALRRVSELFVHLVMAGIACLMVWYGIGLVRTTLRQVYPEFAYMPVGLVYSAIPISGAILLLFVIERALTAHRGADR